MKRPGKSLSDVHACACRSVSADGGTDCAERKNVPGTRWVLIFLLSCAGLSGAAQQYSPRTHFYENSLAYNPATAGIEEEIPIRLNFRQQWTGLKDAPYSQTLSSNGFTGRHLGLGLVLYNDAAGPSRNTGMQASVARHFALDDDGKRWFSFGMAMLLYQYKFDVRRLETDVPNDPAVTALAQQNSRLVPDVAAGFYINDENGFVGISCLNLIQTKSDILTSPDNVNTIERGYYLFAGYRFPLNESFSLEPVTLVKMTETAAWQADVMVKANYNQYWGGLSYRTNDAVSALFGVRVDMFSFSYSYDYPVSEIGSFNKGTHEVTATVHIFNATSRSGSVSREGGGGGGVRDRSFNPVPKRRR
ncbi:MAG TPA: type IX secretion system membrane protein PorP/SprF [Chryseosolibacter sp.]|nr:type IX secretion system membrane protein PorP/SprF [Chryseosolibacter sp.]